MRLFAVRPLSQLFRPAAAGVAGLFLLLAPAFTARAERPSAMKLFPEESVVFIRMSNAHELGEKLMQTSTAKMLLDPQVQPFVEAIYGKAGEMYASKAEGVLGLSWDDLKKLPKGEVALAVIIRPERRPALALLVDQGDDPSVVDKLVDKALDAAQKAGGEFSKEKIGDVEVTIVRDKDRENRMFGVFEREHTIVVATDANVLRGILYHWDHAAGAAAAPAAEKSATEETKTAATEGESEESKKEAAEFVPGRTLAENDRFATIVKECRRPQDPPPQLLFYVDPIELMRNPGRGGGGFQLIVGLFPSLGIDGLQAIGGTATFATDEYTALTQLHVMLENPRSGIMLLPAFQAGETAPQPFVPLDVESYMTWNGNLRTTYNRTEALVDQFRYKGAVEKWVKENISDKLGIDFLTDIVDNLKGRYTWVSGFHEPPSLGTQAQILVAAELVDVEAAKKTLKTVMEKYPKVFVEKHFGTETYYSLKGPDEEGEPDPEKPFDPCVAIMDGYIFVSMSCQRFEKCVAARDGTEPRLIDSSDYARTSEIIGRETRGVTPVIFSMNRPEVVFRHWYGVLTSPRTRELIDEKKEGNEVLTALAEIMDQHKLPPFETLAPYFAPGGGILFDTDTGYHGISFELRNEAKPDTQPAAEAAK